MEINKIEHKIACNEMNAAQVFTQMKQHIDAAETNEQGEAGDAADLTVGVWFQATVSGRWYREPGAAGSVRSVLVMV